MTGQESRPAASPRRTAESGRRTAPQQLPQSAVTAGWRRHKDLLGSASSLVATTGLASLLGFVYWTLAARLFSQQAVGYGSAAVSAMTLLGTIGMLGLGTVLIGELPRRRIRVGLVAAALLASFIGSLVLGLGFVAVAPHVSQRFEHVSGTLVQSAVFVAGVALTGVSLVFDQATIGLLRGGLQLSRNVLFGVAKLLTLPAIALVLHDQFGVAITTSWVAGMAVSVVMVAIWLRVRGTPVLPRPDWGVLRGLGKTAVAHSWLNLSITVPRSLIPVLVTVVVSPTANGAFYAAWTLSGFLYILPTHLSTVLFAVASGDPQVVAKKLRFTLRVSFLIGLPGMLVLGLGAHFALGLFGPGYARAATVVLWLLVLGYLPTVPKMHFIAVCRAAGRISRAAVVLSVSAALEVTAAAAGGAAGGLRGLTLALLAVFFAEGLVTTPPVIRAAMGHGRHRQTAPVVVADVRAETTRTSDSALSGPGTWHRVSAAGNPSATEKAASAEVVKTCDREQQAAGIAALLSLATEFPEQEIPRPNSSELS